MDERQGVDAVLLGVEAVEGVQILSRRVSLRSGQRGQHLVQAVRMFERTWDAANRESEPVSSSLRPYSLGSPQKLVSVTTNSAIK